MKNQEKISQFRQFQISSNLTSKINGGEKKHVIKNGGGVE